jgi:cell wall-associated NlpC family hydrolase
MYLPTGRYRVSVPSITLRLEPDLNSRADDQALHGEDVEVTHTSDGFACVHVLHDGKRLWMDAPDVKLVSYSNPLPARNFRVARPKIIAFREPDAKTEQAVIFSMNSKLTIRERSGEGANQFGQVVGLAGGEAVWVRMNGLMPLKTFHTDFVAVQEMFINTPYKWASRDASPGIDCTGLDGQSLLATGWDYCVRDSKDQVKDPRFGDKHDFPADLKGLKRGDLIFPPGHVMTMVDETRCIHATDLAPYHCVLIQDLRQVIAERSAAGLEKPTIFRRFPNYGR